MRIAVLLLPLALACVQEKPAMLLSGTGIWKHPIHTSSPQGQKFFDQGLNQMYGFNRYEALRSFQKAAELGPKAAMPWWGVAMATGPYVNMDGEPTYQMKTSCATVEEGRKRKPADAGEAAYLDAAAAMPNCTLRDPGRGRWPPWLSAWVVTGDVTSSWFSDAFARLLADGNGTDRRRLAITPASSLVCPRRVD